MKRYSASDCVISLSGTGWPDDNGRPRGNPESFGKNAVAYIDRRGADTRSRIFVIGKRRLYWVDNQDIQNLDQFKTGDEFEQKICLTCGILKPTEDFPKNQTGRGDRVVRRPRCQSCFTRDSGPSLPKETRDSYYAEHAPSPGEPWQCPICEKISIANVNVKIVVDHDQETGKPRGLLCDSCNTGLGRFKNGEDHIQSALDYLKGSN